MDGNNSLESDRDDSVEEISSESDEVDYSMDEESDISDFDDEDSDEFESGDEPSSDSSLSSDELDGRGNFSYVLTDSAAQHGLLSSVRHHQCCDSLLAVDFDDNIIIIIDQEHLVLYNVSQKSIVTSCLLPLRPYSIAQKGSLFVAGDDFCLVFYKMSWSNEGGSLNVRFEKLGTIKLLSMDAVLMNNSVRFALCGSELRLLVANQDGFIYTFSVPRSLVDSAEEGGAQVKVKMEDFICRSLRTNCGQNLERNYTQPVTVEEVRNSDAAVLRNDVIGGFDESLNCSVGSPNGCFLAAVGDSNNVHLLTFESGYSMDHKVSFQFSAREDGGSQYAAWNSTSTMLAVSSDFLQMVRVWAVKWGQPESGGSGSTRTPVVSLVASFGRMSRPCLAVQFDPLVDTLLYFTEKSGRAHVAQLDQESETSANHHQVVSLRRFLTGDNPMVLHGCTGGHTTQSDCLSHGCTSYSQWRATCLFPRFTVVTGLAVLPAHGLFVSCREGLIQYPVLREWSQAAHHHFPSKFKEAIAEVLRICHRGAAESSGHEKSHKSFSYSLKCLPAEILLKVIGYSATPISLWL